MTTFRAGESTDVGRVREANQDLAYVADDLFIVADGMGGHNGGEIAAQVAVETVRDTFTLPTVEALVEAVQDANAAVVSRADTDPELHGMGTTICVVTAVNMDGDDIIGVASVGDSRVYLLAGEELVQVTRDHTLVQMLVDQGQLTATEADTHPQRNILTRALGIDQRVVVDLFLLRPVTGDRYLICSDGLFGEVPDDTIVEVLRQVQDPDEAAGELVRMANDNGGRDNITCVVVDVTDGVVDDLPVAERVLEAKVGGDAVIHRLEQAVAFEDDAGMDGADDGGLDDGELQGDTSDAAGLLVGDGDASDPVDEVDEAAGAAARDGDGGRPERRRGGGGRGKGRAARGAAGPAPSPTGAAPRRFTWRTPVFILLVVVSLAVAVGVVGFYARNTFYVAIEDDEVVIWRGRPGGVLWFEPTLEEETGIDVDDLTGAAREDLRDGKDEPTLDDARDYIEGLREQMERTGPTIGQESGDQPGTSTTTTSDTGPDD